MKTTSMIAILFFGFVAQAFAAGDPVSSVVKRDQKETTTYQRDGKNILIVTVYNSSNPDRRLVRQSVMLDGKAIVELSEFKGKRVFMIRPSARVSVGMQQDSATGSLENIVIEDSNGIADIFKVKDAQLFPVSGEALERNRSFKKDMTDLMGSAKHSTPEQFEKRAAKVVEKHQADKSDDKDAKRTDADPSPQDPSEPPKK